MGAVYEARDTKLADSACAVKEILEGARTGRDSQYVEARFFQEMKALAALDHPSIPKVRDYLTVDSVVYIVMDLVQGQSLDDEIEQSMGLSGQPLAPEKCVEDILALLDTVQYLHQQSPPIIHRDIKPANILRETRSGRIKLVDFGLARQLDDNSRHTLVGTLGYCAPEQMMGKGSFESDLYSVGMTLYHMLTGKQPEMLNLDALTPDLPGLRPGLSQIVEKATQPRPADRYHSCREMMDDLKAWLVAEPTPKPLPPKPEQALAPIPSPVAVPAAKSQVNTLVGISAVLLALGFGLFMGRETAPSTASSPSASPPPLARLQAPAAETPAPPVPIQPPVQVPPSTPVVAEAPPGPPKPPQRRNLPAPPRPQPEPQPAPTVEKGPDPEVGSLGGPAYPTYNGPPIQPRPPVEPQIEAPPDDLPAGGPPEAVEPGNTQIQRKPNLKQWLRNHPNYRPRMRRRF